MLNHCPVPPEGSSDVLELKFQEGFLVVDVQVKGISPGSFIFTVVPVSTTSSTFFMMTWRFSSLPIVPATSTRAPYPNSATITATNSTCANFFPGQTRGPSAQARNVPGFGSKNCSSPKPWLGEAMIQRSGRQVKLSLSQFVGAVCKAWLLTTTNVEGGMV